MRIGILGGGISGITLQRFLSHESEILEKGEVPGGLCRTFFKDGYAYDIGGHILFSKIPQVTELVKQVLGENVNQCRRYVTILYQGRHVKYPFENDLAALDPQDRYECLIGYLQASFPPPSNLEEWAYYTFGRGIADRYFLPYNRKIWKLEPRETGLEFVARIPRPPLEDVVRSALGIPTEGYTHQLHFRYPLRGGIEALVKALIKDRNAITCNAEVTSIRRKGKTWVVRERDTERYYDDIVVAFPIHEAMRCLEDVPPEVQHAIGGLRYNSMRITLVAVNNPSLLDRNAVYLPDPDLLPNRLCYMGSFSPHNVRLGTSSLIAEVTTRPGDEVDTMPEDVFLDRILRDLAKAGILNRADVTTTDTIRIKYAYPVYDLSYSENVRVMREYFLSLGIHLLGRFAEFDYINMDECIHRAIKLAGRLNEQPG